MLLITNRGVLLFWPLSLRLMFVVVSQPSLDAFGRGFPGFQMADPDVSGEYISSAEKAFENHTCLFAGTSGIGFTVNVTLRGGSRCSVTKAHSCSSVE